MLDECSGCPGIQKTIKAIVNFRYSEVMCHNKPDDGHLPAPETSWVHNHSFNGQFLKNSINSKPSL